MTTPRVLTSAPEDLPITISTVPSIRLPSAGRRQRGGRRRSISTASATMIRMAIAPASAFLLA